tara:strand:+ start:700 stop:1350 length:651 start_codon:yes stop_codon:yes gene_type:complete
MNHAIPCIDLSKSRCIPTMSGGMNMKQVQDVVDYYNSMGAKNPPKSYYEASKLLRGGSKSMNDMSDMSDMTESECEKKYNKMISKVERDMGHNGITNQYELKTYCDKNIPNFTTVGGYDKMPKLKNKQSCIINLDDSKGPGSHWVATIRDGRDMVIYDSFGRDSDEILSKLKTGGLRVVDSDYDKEQDELEMNCGARCCAWLVFVHKYGIENGLKI